MQIEIIGTESLGVRGLCCLVSTGDRRVVIDPGVALGFRRHGLLPHPVQVAASERVKSLIEKALQDATDIVISHYHGDHCPLVDANPYQLSADSVAALFMRPRLWTKGMEDLSYSQSGRARSLEENLKRSFTSSEGGGDAVLNFSQAVPHGEQGGHGGYVMMTRIEGEGTVFVHASDIQMLNDTAIDKILDWHPHIVLASGPPLYLPSLTRGQQEAALKRTLHLANGVDTLILDHHLMRSRKGEEWLDYTSSLSNHRIVCAADFMGLRRNLLEAERVLWYQKFHVPLGWHEDYARGKARVKDFLIQNNIHL